MDKTGILTFVILISVLGGFVVYFTVIESPSPIESSNTNSTLASQKMCAQWQQELTEVKVMKRLMGPTMVETTEFSFLMQQEFAFEQKLQFRCP